MKKTEFQKNIGYSFHDSSILEQALTHSSYTKEHKLPRVQCNERLEFLGDAFFDAIVGEELFRRCPEVEEGRLTKVRAVVVCEGSLAEMGNKLHIGDILNLGHGEECSKGRTRKSIVADAMEAIIGAVFLDGGFEAAKMMVLQLFDQRITDALAGKLHSDYKTELQEIVQKSSNASIAYVVTKETGPDHNKTFYVDVEIGGTVAGSGVGCSKKEAQQHAAEQAVKRREKIVL